MDVHRTVLLYIRGKSQSVFFRIELCDAQYAITMISAKRWSGHETNALVPESGRYQRQRYLSASVSQCGLRVNPIK